MQVALKFSAGCAIVHPDDFLLAIGQDGAKVHNHDKWWPICFSLAMFFDIQMQAEGTKACWEANLLASVTDLQPWSDRHLSSMLWYWDSQQRSCACYIWIAQHNRRHSEWWWERATGLLLRICMYAHCLCMLKVYKDFLNALWLQFRGQASFEESGQRSRKTCFAELSVTAQPEKHYIPAMQGITCEL